MTTQNSNNGPILDGSTLNHNDDSSAIASAFGAAAVNTSYDAIVSLGYYDSEGNITHNPEENLGFQDQTIEEVTDQLRNILNPNDDFEGVETPDRLYVQFINPETARTEWILDAELETVHLTTAQRFGLGDWSNVVDLGEEYDQFAADIHQPHPDPGPENGSTIQHGTIDLRM